MFIGTQLNSTRRLVQLSGVSLSGLRSESSSVEFSWVELCRYKRALRVFLEMAPLDSSHTRIHGFVFHCNCRILYRFRNKARYWSKNAFFTPLLFKLRDRVEPLWFPQILTQTVQVNTAENFNPLGRAQRRHRQTTDWRPMHAIKRTLAPAGMGKSGHVPSSEKCKGYGFASIITVCSIQKETKSLLY